MRRLLVLLALLAPTPLLAQISRPVRALELLSADTLDGQWVYAYRFIQAGEQARPLTRLFIDVSTPKARLAPAITGVRGEFLFDALRVRHGEAEITVGHPPLFVGTPDTWFGSIWYDGRLEWRADRVMAAERRVPFGVPAGGSVSGFVLRSPALPALRSWSAVPDLPLDDADGAATVGGASAAADSTIAIPFGIIFAPGWMADEVTGGYLAGQIGLACQGRFVASCVPYQLALDAVRRAELARDDAAWAVALRQMNATLLRDREVHPWARSALGATIAALFRRPPSPRIAPPAPR